MLPSSELLPQSSVVPISEASVPEVSVPVEAMPGLQNDSKIAVMREALSVRASAAKETLTDTAKELFQEVGRPVLKFASVEVVVGAGVGAGIVRKSTDGEYKLSIADAGRLLAETAASRGKNLPSVARHAGRGVSARVADKAVRGASDASAAGSIRAAKEIVKDTPNKYKNSRKSRLDNMRVADKQFAKAA